VKRVASPDHRFFNGTELTTPDSSMFVPEIIRDGRMIGRECFTLLFQK